MNTTAASNFRNEYSVKRLVSIETKDSLTSLIMDGIGLLVMVFGPRSTHQVETHQTAPLRPKAGLSGPPALRSLSELRFGTLHRNILYGVISNTVPPPPALPLPVVP